jgi:hypothetical protein
LLLLVMLVPAFGPLAMANLPPMEGMHCMRRRLSDAPAAAAVMHCHHGASPAGAAENSESPESAAAPETSFRSLDCCCNHCDYGCCCRIPKTSEWATPVTFQLSSVSPLIELVSSAPFTDRDSLLLVGPDSARAPPRR